MAKTEHATSLLSPSERQLLAPVKSFQVRGNMSCNFEAMINIMLLIFVDGGEGKEEEEESKQEESNHKNLMMAMMMG